LRFFLSENIGIDCFKFTLSAGVCCFVLLFFGLCKHCFFTHWKFVATPSWASILDPLFEYHVLILSLCVTFDNSCNISNFFNILWWSVISDLWCYYCKCFEYHKWCPYKIEKLIDKLSILTALITGYSSVSRFPQVSLFSET
jgi:hypothetical protein